MHFSTRVLNQKFAGLYFNISPSLYRPTGPACGRPGQAPAGIQSAEVDPDLRRERQSCGDLELRSRGY